MKTTKRRKNSNNKTKKKDLQEKNYHYQFCVYIKHI